MLRVHGMTLSGNCHKVRLALDCTGKEYEWIEVDTRKKASRTPEFLKLNPHGQVPIVILEDGTILRESNAILYYIARGTPLFPEDTLAGAQVLSWMFFEQYSHEPYIATNRAMISVFKKEAENKDRIAQNFFQGEAALHTMEVHLEDHNYFSSQPGQFSIADIALYAYTHVAHEGRYDLTPYPAIRSWLKRLEGHEGITRMPPCD